MKLKCDRVSVISYMAMRTGKRILMASSVQYLSCTNATVCRGTVC